MTEVSKIKGVQDAMTSEERADAVQRSREQMEASAAERNAVMGEAAAGAFRSTIRAQAVRAAGRAVDRYVFEAPRGAKVTITIESAAGGAVDDDTDESEDTVGE